MELQMERYVQLKDGLNDTGEIVAVNQLSNLIQKLDTKKDWYASLFTYSKEALDHFNNNNGSIAGYKGEVFTNKITFDLDCEVNPDTARIDACNLLEKLQQEGVDIDKSVAVYFSGNKGFHIELTTDLEITPKQLKQFCNNFAGNIKTFDTSIYNTNRIFRIPFTKNQKSGLYKTYIRPSRLKSLSMGQIKIMSQNSRIINITIEPHSSKELLDKYSKVENKVAVIADAEVIDGIRGLETIDFRQCPKNTPRCIYALSKGIMVPGRGERDNLFLRLATFYRNQGAHKEVVYNILKGIARLNNQLYPEAEVHDKKRLWNAVNSAFKEDFKLIPGAIGTAADYEPLKRYCDAIKSDCKCTLHHGHGQDKTVVQIDEVSDMFSNFAENFESNIVRTGINLIDDYMKLTVGTTSLLVGASGSGKTTIALNIMENANKLGQHTYFASLDMHRNLVYLKLAQKLTQYTQDEIMAFYATKNTKKINEIRDIIRKTYSKTYFDFSSTMTLEQMRDKVIQVQERTGNKIKLVVVDYASRISGPYSDSYATARHNALLSTQAADQTDAHWIFIAQIARAAGDGSTPLRSKRVAKESGDWEETASNVITVWRPFMGVENKDYVIRMFLAKNRMGSEVERPLYWDGAKCTVRDLSEHEYAEYQAQVEPEEREYLKNKRNGNTSF